MKILAGLIAFLLVIPAVLVACHCCPLPANDGRLSLERIPCHGCCPEISKPSQDRGTIQEKQVVSSSYNVINFDAASRVNITSRIQEVKNIHVFDTFPPLSSLSFPTTLRI